jgi:hypothetical protein
MSLKDLFTALADVFDGPESIEGQAKQAILYADYSTQMIFEPTELSQTFKIIMENTNAHAVCEIIRTTPLPWLPPQTSTDPIYVAHSLPKVHVELLGPDGLIKSNSVRLGLYGMLPNFEYGIRTHPAEEVFVMLAGAAYWRRGSAPYKVLDPGERSFHPSMMPHANKTVEAPFLSAYVWHGDISTLNYKYEGIPAD